MTRIAFGDTREPHSCANLALSVNGFGSRGATREYHPVWRQIQKRVGTILTIVVMAEASGSLGAQWFKVASPRAPRTATEKSI
jgi:hypothetical protein